MMSGRVRTQIDVKIIKGEKIRKQNKTKTEKVKKEIRNIHLKFPSGVY